MAFNYNNILHIPDRSLLEKRLTKAFFLKNFNLSAAEKKLVNSNIESMKWLASIKPSTANIQAHIDTDYKYEEIQIMVCTVMDNTLKELAEKCIVLFQKYIPYHMLIIVEDANEFMINVCDKRINKNEPRKRTIERHFNTNALSKLYKNNTNEAFFNALSFNNLNKTNLKLLYNSYIQAVVQCQAADITGNYLLRTNERTEEDLQHIVAIEQLGQDIVSLSNQIKKASQLNEIVHLKVRIKNIQDKIEDLKNQLTIQ